MQEQQPQQDAPPESQPEEPSDSQLDAQTDATSDTEPPASADTAAETSTEGTVDLVQDAEDAPPEPVFSDDSVIEESVVTLRDRALAYWDSIQSQMLTLGVAVEAAILLAAIGIGLAATRLIATRR
ncbi:MAG: hypothetical protein AAFW68_09205 [Pseudomonadota bacterium]